MLTSEIPQPSIVLPGNASTTPPPSVLKSSSVPSRAQEGRVLSEAEKAALQNILFALFLESPKRKAIREEYSPAPTSKQ